MVRLRKNAQGKILQSCDVYIGRKVSNESWTLDATIWQNPFKGEISESLVKYEKYVRSSGYLWDQLDDLDGKTLGCWCKPSPCHGDVLARLLEEKKRDEIRMDLYS